MPRKKTINKTTKRTTKRRTCRRTSRTTGAGVMLTLAAIGKMVANTMSAIMKALPGIAETMTNAALTAFSYASTAADFIGPKIWNSFQFLTGDGFKALSNSITSMWKDDHKLKIDTKQVHKVLDSIQQRILRNDPELENDPIFNDINQMRNFLNRVEQLNQQGMDDSTYNEVRRKLTDNLKKIITEFGKLMKHGANGNSNGQETIEEGEGEE